MTKKNIHQRIHEAMGRVDYIQKERKQGMNYTIVSHDAVTAKVRPILHECGIVYYPVAMSASQDGNRTQVQMAVRFANIDEPADYIDVQSLGYGIDAQDKGPGKAISYAIKYALLKTLGLETGDDPDTENVKHEPAPKKPTVSAASPWQSHPPAAPSAAPNDWQIIGNDMLAAVGKLMTKRAINNYVATHKEDLDRMQTGAPEEYQRVKGGIEARHALLPAMAP